jgi:hypothetical protein
MSGRVSKAKAPARSSRFRHNLLSTLDRVSFDMPSCSNCERRGLSSCRAAPADSSRCEACVRNNRSGCDVLGPSEAQLNSASLQFQRLEQELDFAEDEVERAQAKARRIRRSRRLLAEKIQRMVRRGIDSLEELERVEAEERAGAVVQLTVTVPLDSLPSDSSSSDPCFSDLGAFVLSESQQAEFDRFLADPGAFGGTPEQLPASSQDAR